VSPSKRILFVDDEARVREQLQRLLRPFANEWETTFVGSGAEALALLEQSIFDVLVTDLAMPEMSGIDLLREVQTRHPKVVRFVLAAPSDQPLVMSCAALTHQFLTRPCEPQELRDAIIRACDIEASIRRENTGRLIARMDQLPSLPSIYLQLVEKMRDPECGIEDVAELVARDISLTARVLKLVNSAFFGLRQQVSSLNEAVNYLGLDTLKALVLSINAFSQFEKQSLGRLSLDSLWNHSLLAAGCAKLIADMETGSARVVDEAFVAAMLHDTGKLVLAANLAAEYEAAMSAAGSAPLAALGAEESAFGATHADVGGYLFSLWGLPGPIVDAVMWHHDPLGSPESGFGPLACVHAANAWTHGGDESGGGRLNREYFERQGLSDRIGDWHRACVENYLGGVGA
jgi:HD-like signal output (HDOD) protein